MTGDSPPLDDGSKLTDELLLGMCLSAGRVVVIAPHPDDEAIGTAILMRRMALARIPVTLVFATSGVPQRDRLSPTLLHRWNSFEAYVAARKAETATAVNLYGVNETIQLPLHSREIINSMVQVDAAIEETLVLSRGAILFMPPYEGGHPDHDLLNCICATIAKRLGTACFEYMAYHLHGGVLRFQEFRHNRTPLLLSCTQEEVAFKRIALRSYASQYDEILKYARPDIEGFSRVPQYEYTDGSWPEQTFYEAWGSGVTSHEVSGACSAYLNAVT